MLISAIGSLLIIVTHEFVIALSYCLFICRTYYCAWTISNVYQHSAACVWDYSCCIFLYFYYHYLVN